MGEGGAVTVLLATAGEAPPAPSPVGQPEFILLLDPQWGDRGLVQWSVGQAHFVALSAPYCFNDGSSVDAMYFMFRSLRAKGYTAVALTQSNGMQIKLPEDVPGLGPATHTSYSWEMVPECLNRSGSGMTPASYGG